MAARGKKDPHARRGKPEHEIVRGTPTTIPQWWFDEVRKEMLARGWTDDAQLVEAIHGSRGDGFTALQTKMSRFLAKEVMTVELAEEIMRVLGVPRYEFKAGSRAEAERIQAAIKDEGQEISRAIVERVLRQAVESRGDQARGRARRDQEHPITRRG